ncbi:transmembrane protein [Coprinopsis cinerea okayama7|uniref:Transmembrane protein n=1 Tax=Coprinopsis cinerea (strain Okayama-7 / 130 / ATCC MYA-4618 / FGSC 9003) TaxID=240176 RepID=A8NCF8_COPC7|nr:transmembrane protein [Coprinopsis cinerea okayama7\|eukprot:XP_001832502.1 transmembrane protein [Coprinopsis cinerea okayama7\
MATNPQEEQPLLEKGPQVFDEDKAKGGNVYHFDPDAPPEQKGAEALRVAQDKLAPMKGVGENTGAKLAQGISAAVSTAAPFEIPSIVVEDSDKPEEVKPDGTPAPVVKVEGKDEATEEAAPTTTKYTIPDWYIVGWRQALGLDKPPLTEGEEKDNAILSKFVSEQFYVAWYNNAGIIVFAVLSSHFVTWLGFGWGWLLVILGVCYTHYTTTVKRFERDARDDMVREMTKAKRGPDHPETVEWMNGFLERFWNIYEPVLSATITTSVDQILSISTPTFLDALRLSEFSLGSKAPRIEKIWTMVEEEDDVVQMDWDISFAPNDVANMTIAQVDKKLNPRVLLEIRIGKGLAVVTIPVLVEDITVTGRIRIRMKLSAEFPYVQVLDFCFMEKPVIDYSLKPLGGDTFGVDITNIPGLSSFIRDTTHWVLGPMMYHPAMYRLNLEQIMSGRPLETAIGVLEVMVHSARGVKGSSLGDKTPDPYVSLAIDQRPAVARTKWRSNTTNPTWMETKYVLVNKLEGKLNLHVYDYNDRRSNVKLSTASFDLALLREDSVQENITSRLMDGEKDRGELRYNVTYYPVIEPPEPGAETADKDEAIDTEDSTIGIVRLVIHQAKELDTATSLNGELSPLAKVYINNGPKSSFTTATYKHTLNPVWEAPYEFLCSSKDTDIITIKVINDRDFRRNPTIGFMSVALKDLLECKSYGKEWFNLNDCKSGKIRVSATWKPVAMSGSLHGADRYVPPIGAVKLWIKKAVDVKNVESGFGGKSDPYVRVQVRNETKGKTKVIDNNLNPVWDEIFYVPVHDLTESIMMDCFDEQTVTKDRPLGSVELLVSQVAKKSDDPRTPYESTGTKKAADPLVLKRDKTKGVLHYEATFVPAWQVDIQFDKQKGHPNAKKVKDDEDGGDVSDASSDHADSSPVRITYRPSKRHTLSKINTKVQAEDGEATAVPGSPTEPSPTAPSTPPQSAAPVRIQYPVEELLAQQSGIIVVNVVSGILSVKGRIEVALDDFEWPCVSTPKSRSKSARWEFVGEGFIKEIDFGQVHLYLDAADEEGEDKVVSEWNGPVKDFLRDTFDGPKEYVLTDKNGKNPSTVLVEARYIPVSIVLEPRETVSNQGILRVTLLDGEDILAVDRGGTRSDPYAVFTLDGSKVFKSEPHKKTLTPVWNVDFEVTVPSRAAADFQIEVFDWNRVESDESLGSAQIDLQSLEPFRATERIIALSTPKHGQKGRIRLQLLFNPMIIAKTRKTASTFTSVGGRAMTQIGALPVNAGKGVLHGVTSVFSRD